MFKQRVIEPEELDHLPASQARPNLADLVRINGRLGGHSTLRKSLAQVARPADTFSILDVGAASGDAARLIGSLYPGASVHSLDSNAINLAQAPFPKLLGDAFHLPFSDGVFDIVVCSLFLHHFENEEIEHLLRSFYRVARKALLVFDLERHILPYLFLPLTRPIFRWNTITVTDGMKSVRAAFRLRELEDLARAAGLKGIVVRSYRPAFRLALTAQR
jgi:ubiquinone/menaquinone biosynthesis C-methylase UbiE